MELAIVSQDTAMETRNKKRKYSKAAKSSAAATSGLTRYLKNRGTPSGTYDIVRTTETNFAILGGGFIKAGGGSTATAGLCMTFSPQSVRFYDTTGSLWYTLSLPNSAEIAALWDDVKLANIECTFGGAFFGTSASTNGQPTNIIYCTDDNDTALSRDIILQAGDCKTWFASANSNQCVKKLNVKPKFQNIIYYTALLSGYKPATGYIRSDYDIEHYGVKMMLTDTIEGPTADPIGRMNFTFRYTLRCKNLK